MYVTVLVQNHSKLSMQAVLHTMQDPYHSADINQSASLVQNWRTCLLEQQAVHDLAEKRCLIGWYSVLWPWKTGTVADAAWAVDAWPVIDWTIVAVNHAFDMWVLYHVHWCTQ
jgi:hypothetical protein